MKKLLLLAIILSSVGCQNNKQIKLIEQYVCTTDGVTSDLSFKSLNLEEISSIKATDSILYFMTDTLPTKYIWKGDSCYFIYPDDNGSLQNEVMAKAEIDSQQLSWIHLRKSHEKSLIEAKANLKGIEKASYEHSYAYVSFMTDLYESSINNAEKSIKIIDDVIKDLESAKKYSLFNNDSVLLRAFECTYSIVNPVLKIKQTQTQIFYFDNDISKVIDSFLKK